MLNDKAVRGTNFTCVHAGPMAGWAQFRLEPPDVPLPARGKLFLRNLLGSAGLEMSLNVVPPTPTSSARTACPWPAAGHRAAPAGTAPTPPSGRRGHR